MTLRKDDDDMFSMSAMTLPRRQSMAEMLKKEEEESHHHVYFTVFVLNPLLYRIRISVQYPYTPTYLEIRYIK